MRRMSDLRYLAKQLELRAAVLRRYGRREQTRSDHAAEIREYVGYDIASPSDLKRLETWLVDRTMEHDSPSLLFRFSRERLRSNALVSPPAARIARIVGTARRKAQEKTFERLRLVLTSDLTTRLDRLLEARSPSGPVGL